MPTGKLLHCAITGVAGLAAGFMLVLAVAYVTRLQPRAVASSESTGAAGAGNGEVYRPARAGAAAASSHDWDSAGALRLAESRHPSITAAAEAIQRHIPPGQLSSLHAQLFFAEAFADALSVLPHSVSEMGSVLRLIESRELQLAALETWLELNWQSDLGANHEALVQISALGGGDLDPPSLLVLQRLVIRVAMRQPGDGKALLAYASEGGEELRMELAAYLPLRPELFASAVESDALSALDFGALAGSADLTPAALQELLAGFSDEMRMNALLGYSAKAFGKTRPMGRDFAAVLSADKLPPKLQERLTAELLQFGSGEVSGWLAAVPEGQHAALLDKAVRYLFSSFEGRMEVGGDRSKAARSYLELRCGGGEVAASDVLRAAQHLSGIEPRDLEALFAGLQKPLRDEVMLKVLSRDLQELARVNVDGIHNLLALAPASIAGALEAQAAPALASHDYSSAVAFIEALPEGSRRTSAWVALLSARSLSLSAEERIARISALLEDGVSQEQATAMIKQLVDGGGDLYHAYLGFNNIDRCRPFIDSLPDALKEQVVSPFVQTWAAYMPVAASEWVAALPPGATRNKAAYELVLLSRDDPEIALANAAAIFNPQLRASAVQDVVSSWKLVDREFMKQVLRNSPLSEGEKESFSRELAGKKVGQ